MNKGIISIITLILLAPAVIAIPSFHHFYGNVIDTDGNPVSGTVYIVAYIDNAPHGSIASVNGAYGYDTLFFVEDGNTGDTITFYTNGYESATYTFENEQATELELTLDESQDQVLCENGICDSGEDCSNCPGDCGQCGGGAAGGGGGGGGGGERPCVESWICGDWTPEICPVTRQQTRTCTDRNNCGTSVNKPNEVRTCFYYVAPEEEVVEEEEGIEQRIIERLAPKEKRKVSTRTFIILGALLLSSLILIVVKWQYLLKGKWEGYDVSRLRVYIRKYLSLNYPRRKIIEACKKVGWKTSVVKRVIGEEKKMKK